MGQTQKPIREKDYQNVATPLFKFLRFTPLLNLLLFPVYLLSDDPQSSGNHFFTHSRLYPAKERLKGAISISCTVLFFASLWWFMSPLKVLALYGGPYVVFVLW